MNCGHVLLHHLLAYSYLPTTSSFQAQPHSGASAEFDWIRSIPFGNRKMSTHSLISYTTQPAPSLRAPSYASRPFESELTVAFNERLRRGTGNFVKHSKHGHARLNLIAQQEGVETPVYGISGLVKGIIELDDVKTEGVDSVQIKVWFVHWVNQIPYASELGQIEGYLKVHELGESGDSTTQLVLDTKLLWVKGPGSLECPKVIDFQLMLPTTFTTNDGVTYVRLSPMFILASNFMNIFNSLYLQRSKSNWRVSQDLLHG